MTPLQALWVQAGPAIAAGLIVSAGLCAAVGHRKTASWLAIISLLAAGFLFAFSLASTGAALPLRIPVAGWGAPLGVEAWIDPFSAFICSLILWICAPCLVICLARTHAGSANASPPGIIGALTICSGAMFAALLGDMISLWLALTLASFGAVALAADRPQSSAGAFRVLMVSGAGGVLHAVGVVLVIATAGTPALLGSAGQIGRSGDDALLAVGMTCVFVGVIAQSGLFPFHAVVAQAVRGAPRGSGQALVMVLGVAAIAVLARWTQALGADEPSRLAAAGLSVLAAWGGVGALASAAAAVRAGEVRAVIRYAFASAAMTAVMMLATGGRVADAALLWLAGAVTGAAAAAVALDAGGYEDTVPLDRLEGFAARAPIMAAAFGIGVAGLAALPLTPTFLAAFEGMSALFAALQPIKGAVIAAVIVLLATAALRMAERIVSRTETGRTVAMRRGAMHLAAAIFALVLLAGAWTARPLNELALLAAGSVQEPSR